MPCSVGGSCPKPIELWEPTIPTIPHSHHSFYRCRTIQVTGNIVPTYEDLLNVQSERQVEHLHLTTGPSAARQQRVCLARRRLGIPFLTWKRKGGRVEDERKYLSYNYRDWEMAQWTKSLLYTHEELAFVPSHPH